MSIVLSTESLESRQARLREDLFKAGRILKGHFKLRRGDHSDTFIDFMPAMEIPGIKENVGAILIIQLEEEKLIIDGRPMFDVIMGPARGAIPIGKVIKSLLPRNDILAIYPKRGANGKFDFEYPFEHIQQIRTLYVDDVFSTGSSLREIMALCDAVAAKRNEEEPTNSPTKRNAAFDFVGSAVAINRVLDIKKFELNTITFPTSYGLWVPTRIVDPSECEQCKEGVPLLEGSSI
jgi:orotate phosphoribosyltransferase